MIYNTDIQQCNAFAQGSAANLKRSALFVLATIQQQLETTPVIVSDFELLGTASRFSWGMKTAGIQYLEKHIAELYRQAIAVKNDPAELLRVFLDVPGFGLVKAGFLCQLFANVAGCIDVHNIKLYDIPLAALRYGYKLKEATKTEKRKQYIALCHGLGGSAALWSRWCDYVAALRPNNWENGAAVSEFHFDVISGRESGAIVDLFSGVNFDPKYSRS